MAVRVRFRMNKVTGEVEEFLVDDEDRTLSEADHDRIAADIGRVLARRPVLTEVPPEPPAPHVLATGGTQQALPGEATQHAPAEPERHDPQGGTP